MQPGSRLFLAFIFSVLSPLYRVAKGKVAIHSSVSLVIIKFHGWLQLLFNRSYLKQHSMLSNPAR